jgi:hypothetical protein
MAADTIGGDSWVRLVTLARHVMDDEGRRAVDRAAWLGAVIRLRAATKRLKEIAPSAVPLGFGAYSDVELLQWWRADPITPIRAVLAGADLTFAGRPGFFESLGAGAAGAFDWLWKLVVGFLVFVGVVVVGGVMWWAVRK